MDKPRRYHPSFVDDLSSAISYYDGISTELGNRFRQAVREKLSVVSRSPELFGKIQSDVRALRTNRFPYVLLFQDTPETVVILGIKHAASDPQTWLLTFDRE